MSRLSVRFLSIDLFGENIINVWFFLDAMTFESWLRHVTFYKKLRSINNKLLL